MKHSLLLLSLLLLGGTALSSCSSDLEGEIFIAPEKGTSVTTKDADATAFPEADGAQSLNNPGAADLRRLLSSSSMNPERALSKGEMTITDAQFAEIKAFVDENLKDSTETATYNNIFAWVVKNLTYAYDGNVWLDPYDVFLNRRCICQGYANLCRTMLLTQGIPAFGANGMLSTIGAHAWLYAYVDGKWVVSDPTNNQQYSITDLTKYRDMLKVERVDIPLFEDEQFEYSYDNKTLAVTKVKPGAGDVLTIPYSAGGYIVRLFLPRTAIPENVRQICFGKNIMSFGPDEMPYFGTCPNVEEAFVDPASTYFSSENGVVYKRKTSTPVYIPRGIRRLVLRPMTVIGKNTIYCLDNVEEIVFSEGTTTIEAYAIEQCPNLKRVYIPESVTSMDENAIYRCPDDVEILKTSTGIHHVKV